MSKNIILRTINEVKYFHRRVLFAITLKEKVTFLILSNDIIFDIDSLKNYLIENELNHFAKNEIINLIELIDSFLNFKMQHETIPKNENHFSYEYPTKGKGFGEGNLMYILKVNDQLIKTNEATFNEKEPLYSRLTNLRYFNISNRLLEIKGLFATFLEQPQQVEAVKPEKTLLEFKEFIKKHKDEALQFDLKQDNYNVWDILENQKMKLNATSFNEVADEVAVFCRKAITSMEQRINNDIKSKSYIYDKKSCLNDTKVYFEYLELYKLAVNKTNQSQQPETPQKNKEIEQYLQSYKQSCFSSVIDKQDNNKQNNILFYSKVTADVLEQRNKDLLSNEILKERSNLLSDYNKHLYYLTGHTMQLFKAVNDYSKTSDNGYFTKIKIIEDNIFNCLGNIKDIAKVIKHNIINDEVGIAQKIKDYCILMFDDCIDLLNKRFGVDIYKSPMNVHFENVKQEFINSINYAELKIIDDLRKSAPASQQQLKTVKRDEVNENYKLTKNLFDDVEPNKVFQHFKILVDNSYITQQNFNDFISAVFERNEVLPIKIEIIKTNSKTRVKKIFYTYFETYVQNKYGSQKKYIDLLCNNFTGFNAKTLSTNFAK